MVFLSYDTDFDDTVEENRLTLENLIDSRYEKSYTTLQSIAQTTLGPYYEDLKRFYRDIFLAYEYQYIVFVARRSIALAELFSIILWHENSAPNIRRDLEDSWAISTSDSTIISHAAQIAEKLKVGSCPKLLVVDDLLIQGNGMNELLSTIEYHVIKELKSCTDISDIEKYQQSIVNSIDIRVFSQNSQVSIVNLQYQLRLKPRYRMQPREWHDLSRRISGMIVFSGMANATFIMGAELPAGIVDSRMLAQGIRLEDQTVIESAVEKSGTFYERHYFEWKDSGQRFPKYFCTLRVIKNPFTNQYLLMPFVFLPQLTDHAYDLLKKKIFSKWGIDSSSCQLICEAGKTSRLEFEAMILHLCESLMMCWTRSAGIALSPESYVPTKVVLNYGVNHLSPLMSKEHFFRLTDPAYLFSWSELTALLQEATQDAQPLSFPSSSQAFDTERIRREIEDNVYMTKLQELVESYRCSQSLPPDNGKEVLDFSLQQNRQTNWNIFLDQFNASIFKHIPSVSTSQLFRLLLEFMDFGIVTLKARQSQSRFAQVLRMSEQSLFIHPRRYSIYYPTLLYLEERKLRLGTNPKEELRVFLTHEQAAGILDKSINVETLTKELTQYLLSLQKSGQDLKDWDIGFEKSLILDLNSMQTDAKTRRLFMKERLAYMDATGIRRILFNDCHAFYPL